MERKQFFEHPECRILTGIAQESWCQSAQTEISGIDREGLETDEWYEF